MARRTAENTGPAVAFEGPDHAPQTEVADTGADGVVAGALRGPRGDQRRNS